VRINIQSQILNFKSRFQQGFTLVELMVAISVSIILGSLGIVGFSNYNRAQVLQTSTNEITTMLNLARSRAQSQIKPSGCSGTLHGYGVHVSSETTYRLIIFCDTPIVLKEIILPKNVVFPSGSINKTIFFPVQTGTSQILDGVNLESAVNCGANNCMIILSSGEQGKTISVNFLGRVSVGMTAVVLTPTPVLTNTPTPTLIITSTPTVTPILTITPTSTPTPWLSGYSYRKAITVNNAIADYQMRLIVNKGSGTDSGSTVYLQNYALSWTGTVPNDLRFTSADQTSQLNYWIESSDTNTATVWVKNSNPASSTIYIYYGKASDVTTSNGNSTFIFFDDFTGTTINTTKWTKVDVGGYISQNGVLTIANGTAVWGQTGMYSNSNFNRSDNILIQGKYKSTAVRGTSYKDTTMLWTKNTTADLNYTTMIYGLYPYELTGSYPLAIYEDGNSRGAPYNWVANTQYWFRQIIKSAGGATTQWSTNGSTWSTVYDSSYSTATSMKVALTHYQGGDVFIDDILVRKYVSPEPSWATWGSVEGEGFPTITPTPTLAPSCSDYSDCASCVIGAPYTCGWNGISCESKPAQNSCPATYTQWYWGSCSSNICAAPTTTPTRTPTPTITSVPTVTPTPPAYFTYGGYYWWKASAANLSCTTVCSTHGGVKVSGCNWPAQTDCTIASVWFNCSSMGCSLDNGGWGGPGVIDGICYYHNPSSGGDCSGTYSGATRICACNNNY